MLRLEQLTFENTYSRLPDLLHEAVFPTPFEEAWIAASSPQAAACIDLDPNEFGRSDFSRRLMLASPWPGTWPLAQAYSGHQFGTFVPNLGDGRAILIGEITCAHPTVWNPYRNLSAQRWDLQLKGAGRTCFSRQFDGRAAFRSCIREFLASEALHHLGIPSTRALCVLRSNEPIFRECPEPGAMLARLSPSHIRFGTFEFLYHQRNFQALQALADYAIVQFFSEVTSCDNPYAGLLREIVVRTAQLVAHWQAFGFTHGVLNSDNFSILGLTLDYGPFGFLDDFDPDYVANQSDHTGLYAFGRQPEMAYFNLQCLARAMSPLMQATEARESLEDYEPELARCYLGLMADKLGLLKRQDDDEWLIQELMVLLKGVDYTRFFRGLSKLCVDNPERDQEWLKDLNVPSIRLNDWLPRYRNRLAQEQSLDMDRRIHMNKVNPQFILRNYLAEQAIRQAQDHGNNNAIQELLAVLAKPFDEQPESSAFAESSPEWGRRLHISCSS